jgi:hypothetical protein
LFELEKITIITLTDSWSNSKKITIITLAPVRERRVCRCLHIACAMPKLKRIDYWHLDVAFATQVKKNESNPRSVVHSDLLSSTPVIFYNRTQSYDFWIYSYNDSVLIG